MVPPPVASCCSALLALLAKKTSFPGSSVYNASLTSYFSAQEAEVHPSCIVSPTSSADVSSAVGTLTRLNCDFAIRSGGHSTWAGDANIAGGVTIDLQGLHDVTVSQDKSKVSVGPGARWGDVYSVTEVSQLVVPGGRVGTVGVGGLSTGGGLSSFSPRFGWTCDNVASMEVVLANGNIVTVNDSQNTDLLQVLRGGSNNFGVITRFDFHAYPQGDIWGGTVNYNITTLPQQLDAVSKLASADPYDEFASVTMNIVYGADGTLSVQNGLQYTRAVEYPAFLKPLTDIPHSSDTLRVGNLTNFASEGVAGNPDGLRTLLATTTHGTSLEMFTAAFNAWNKSNAAFAGTSILQARLFWEPYPQATYQKAASGSNVLGLSGDQGALVVVGVAAAWSNASEDALMNQLAQTVVTNIDTAAKKLGQHYEYKYLNYASPWQDVIQSYGAANMAKLRNMSKKYDPRGIFQKNVPGGFKLV
ncbi:hypothetical protein F4820DRAFT_741 [Hypoxylon rubiginosum]|uniref:Uncharacterized protein n=1 Tax=Hypoxylon rubiginosum TaxID=110542 RepID=A0ACB9ZIR0_9PEZI|nr:hypothetical protein F4820DRAFT_741 [Hypoxylon rubiginosum]